MPEIKLTEGDFGVGVARADSSAFYLSDPARPGALLVVPLTDVAEMEAVADDHSGRIRDGLKMSARGFATAGPIGLAAGLLAARHVKDVVFRVTFSDGRHFVATASATTFADLHGAQIAARVDEAGLRADDIIGKYVAEHSAEAAPPDMPAATQTAAPAPPLPPPSAAASSARPVFGRRGR